MVKRILNYYIDYRFRESILDELIDELDLQHFCQAQHFYMNNSQMTEMQQNGMIIGSHSIHHPVMAKLTYSQQQNEIQQSFIHLHHLIHPTSKTFCYPYGGSHTYTEDTINILNQENCIFSFDVNPRDITIQDIQQQPQTLPRYDCNQFPFGQVRS